MGVCCAVCVEDGSEPSGIDTTDWKWLGEVLVDWQFWSCDKFRRLGLSANSAEILKRIEGSVYEVGVDDPENAWQDGSAVHAALAELRGRIIDVTSDTPSVSAMTPNHAVDAEALVKGVIHDIDIALELCQWAMGKSKRIMMLAF